MLLGALVLGAFVTITHDRLPRDHSTWGHLIIAALVANAAPYLLFALGKTRIDSSIAGVMNATTPLWTLALVAVIRPAESIQPTQVAGFVLGLIGCIVGIFGTGLAYIINYALIRHEGPTRASVVTYLVPLVSVTVGAAALNEPLTPNLLTGSALVLIGIAVSRHTPSKAVGQRKG